MCLDLIHLNVLPFNTTDATQSLMSAEGGKKVAH